MAIKRVSRVLLFLAASGLLVIPIYSCGPFFESAVFTFQTRPDGPDQDFAAGKIGVLLPGFRSSYLTVAYRYLLGAKLSSEQQTAALQVWQGM